MFCVKRNKNGEITSIHKASSNDTGELKLLMDEEVINFLTESKNEDSRMGFLSASDIEAIRIIEDLIEVLVNKNIILFTDLPESAQQKIRARKQVRGDLDISSIMIDDDNVL